MSIGLATRFRKTFFATEIARRNQQNDQQCDGVSSFMTVWTKPSGHPTPDTMIIHERPIDHKNQNLECKDNLPVWQTSLPISNPDTQRPW